MIRRLLPLVVLLGSASVWAAESCPAESDARPERAKVAQADPSQGEAAGEGAAGSVAARVRGGPTPPPARARWHRTLPGMFK